MVDRECYSGMEQSLLKGEEQSGAELPRTYRCGETAECKSGVCPSSWASDMTLASTLVLGFAGLAL